VKKLSSYTNGRDNNFNLIRITAAFAVLVSHSFALALGSGKFEPLRSNIGMSPGDIAVDVFFVTSGFLVTSSLFNRANLVEFIWARLLRIFPALIMMLILTVFVLGPVFTSIPIGEYFSSKAVFTYPIKCSTLFIDMQRTLPGVFENNPYKGSANGSLWSMPFEVRMYAILAASWMIMKSMHIRLESILIIFAVAAGAYTLANHFYGFSESRFSGLFFMFFTGSSFYVMRDRIRLWHGVALWMVIALIIATINKDQFFVVYHLSLAYVLFYLAYVPAGFIRKFNVLGDYSYGIYIYAFPVQQSVAALIPGVSVLDMIAIAGSVTLLLSIASWHLIEKNALSLKGRYVDHTIRLFNIKTAKNTA
jgi:peptidoglycan/LPS O-acetylase OafA/YrhL